MKKWIRTLCLILAVLMVSAVFRSGGALSQDSAWKNYASKGI